MAGSTIGRIVVDVQTNKSGGAVAYGDVVVSDASNDHSFTTTTSAGLTSAVIGVCIEPNGIANNATGRIQFQGYCGQVNCNASVTRGYFLKTHTVAKQAAGSSTRVVGTFGVTLKTSATPDAYLWGLPDATAATGNVAADPIWDAAGDLAVGSGADAAARLAIGAAGGALSVINSAVAWNSGTSMPANKATGDRYWRTDLFMEFCWDGTRWFCTCPHSTTIAGQPALQPFSAAQSVRGAVGSLTATRRLIKTTAEIYVATTNTGSAYWTITAPTGNLSTVSLSADAVHELTSSTAADLTADQWIQCDFAKVSTPGNIFGQIVVEWRYVTT